MELDSFVDKNIKNKDLRNIIMNLHTIIKTEQNIDGNLNTLLNHFNENQICDITVDNAESICETLLSIYSMKNFDHEVCFELIDHIIESGSLKNEYYPGLAKNLVEYSGADRPLNKAIQHLVQDANKQNKEIDLSNLLKVAIDKLKPDNVNVLLKWCNVTAEECQGSIKKLQLNKENNSDTMQKEKLDKIINSFEKTLNEIAKNPNKDHNTVNEVEPSAINEFTLIDKKNYPLSIQQWNAMIDCLGSTDNLYHWKRQLRNSLICPQEFKELLIKFNNKDLPNKKKVLDSLLIMVIKTTKPDILEFLLENGANLSNKELRNNCLKLALRKSSDKQIQDNILKILKILTSEMIKSDNQLGESITELLNKAIELDQPYILDFIFGTSYEGKNNIDEKHQTKRQLLEADLSKNENEITDININSSSKYQNSSSVKNLKSEQAKLIDEWLDHVQLMELRDKVKEETDTENLSNVEICLDYYKNKYHSSKYPQCLYEKFSNLLKEVQAKIFSLGRCAADNSQMDVDELAEHFKGLNSSGVKVARQVFPGGAERGMSYLFEEQPAALSTEPAVKRRAASEDGGSQPKISIGLFQAQPMSSVQEDEPMEANYTPSP